MRLIAYYLALSLAADVVAVFLCLWIERYWPEASMPIFIGLYFGILWGAWVIAIRLTEPKEVTTTAAQSQPAE